MAHAKQASKRKRSSKAVPALGAAVVVLLVVDPSLAADAGFALSVCATGGLLLLAPGWRDALRRRRIPAGLASRRRTSLPVARSRKRTSGRAGATAAALPEAWPAEGVSPGNAPDGVLKLASPVQVFLSVG